MIGVRWRKVARDLTTLRARTLLVVLSIAIGVFAVGTISGSAAALRVSLDDGYARARSANLIVYTTVPFDEDLVQSVRRIPGVGIAEGRRTVSLRVRTGDTWRELQLTAIPDWRDQSVDVVIPLGDAPVPARGEILLERSTGTIADLPVGGDATIELPDGSTTTVRIGGLAWEPGATPAYYFGRLSGYATFDTLADLGFDDRFQEVRVRAVDPVGVTPGAVKALTDAVRLRLERADAPVSFVLTTAPGRHPAQDLLDAIFVVLGGLGVLSLVVSGFLVANTIGVILTQQTRQIGVMKAVGAGRPAIVSLYLGLVTAYAALALLVGIPAAVLGGHGLAVFVTALVNLDPGPVAVDPQALVLMVAVGLAVPLAASIVPVLRGTSVTVHAAIRYTGVAETYGHGALDRAVASIRGLPRPVLLALRNAFRRKGRLALTLAALAFGSAVAMTVFSVRDGLESEMRATFGYFRYDVQVDLARPVRAASATAVVRTVPGVATAEAWQYGTAIRLRSDGSESGALTVFGLPADVTTVRPTLETGRWLLPGEGHALVVTANLLKDEPDLRLGDTVRLKLRGRTAVFTLVGTIRSPTMQPALYMSDVSLGELTGASGRASVLAVAMDPAAGRTAPALAAAVRAALEDAGIAVTGTTTSGDIATTITTLFDTLILVVTAMAMLLGVVGALGLAGTMTMNVVERSREIGILRAVGAPNRSVAAIVIAEGLVVGALSWAAGAIAAIPIGAILAGAIGEAFLGRPLPSAPSIPGFSLWLVVVLALAAAGSVLPAWRASRLTVREVLAYE